MARMVNAAGMFAIVVAGMSPEAAWAQQVASKPFGTVPGWTISSLSSDGAYMRCAAKPTGSSASIEKSSEGLTVLVPTKLAGDSIKGSIAVDGKSSTGEFFRMDDNRVGLFLKPAQQKSVQSGKVLVVTLRTETATIPLTNIAAVVMLSACDAKGGG